jgi:hypothetical protein
MRSNNGQRRSGDLVESVKLTTNDRCWKGSFLKRAGCAVGAAKDRLWGDKFATNSDSVELGISLISTSPRDPKRRATGLSVLEPDPDFAPEKNPSARVVGRFWTKSARRRVMCRLHNTRTVLVRPAISRPRTSETDAIRTSLPRACRFHGARFGRPGLGSRLAARYDSTSRT